MSLDLILQLTGFTIDGETANALLQDELLVKYLSDKRVRKGDIVKILRDYETNGIQEKAKEIKEAPKDKTYTYHRFILTMLNGNQVRILTTNKTYNELKTKVAAGQRCEIGNFFKKYGISPSGVKSSSVEKYEITWLERETMIYRIKHGKIGVHEKRFLAERNFNYTIISKEEVENGITAAHLEKLFGLQEGALRTEEENKKPITLDMDFLYNPNKEIKNLGTQKMFMGQNLSVYSIFNIKHMSQFVIVLPANEYVEYDKMTGALIPHKEGEVAITITNIYNDETRRLVLSVGPSPKQSLKDFIHKKKSMELKPETKKDSQ